MTQEILVNWKGKMSFDTVIDGHELTIDAAPEHGGKNAGPRPKQLLLLALSGCTAMDVVSLSEKMRAGLERFSVKVEATLSDEHPKRYLTITLYFICEGKTIDQDKIKKAVTMSEEKYCGVWATLRDSVKVNYKIMFP